MSDVDPEDPFYEELEATDPFEHLPRKDQLRKQAAKRLIDKLNAEPEIFKYRPVPKGTYTPWDQIVKGVSKKAACYMCHFEFKKDSLSKLILVHLVRDKLLSWGVTEKEMGHTLIRKDLAYRPAALCCFCLQFFDIASVASVGQDMSRNERKRLEHSFLPVGDLRSLPSVDSVEDIETSVRRGLLKERGIMAPLTVKPRKPGWQWTKSSAQHAELARRGRERYENTLAQAREQKMKRVHLMRAARQPDEQAARSRAIYNRDRLPRITSDRRLGLMDKSAKYNVDPITVARYERARQISKAKRASQEMRKSRIRERRRDLAREEALRRKLARKAGFQEVPTGETMPSVFESTKENAAWLAITSPSGQLLESPPVLQESLDDAATTL